MRDLLQCNYLKKYKYPHWDIPVCYLKTYSLKSHNPINIIKTL